LHWCCCCSSSTFFGRRLARTRKFMPSGMMVILSIVALVLLNVL
jgi:uncharacterized membrane protein (UPF0136 family)